MGSKQKRRMVAVAGIIVIVAILALALVAGSTSATVSTVSKVASGQMGDKKIEVTGNVVDNSYSINEQGVLSFDIVDPSSSDNAIVHVSYDRGVSATFGNGVTAICTGRMQGDTLVCSELVTKCPSKYENASDALTISQLNGYGSAMVGKTTKVAGVVKAGTLGSAVQDVRFVLEDQGAVMKINYGGALGEKIAEGTKVVVMGALDENGTFLATDVALEA